MVTVKCSQTGKHFVIKVGYLTMEDGTDPVLEPGSHILMEYQGKTYPVEFVCDVSGLVHFMIL